MTAVWTVLKGPLAVRLLAAVLCVAAGVAAVASWSGAPAILFVAAAAALAWFALWVIPAAMTLASILVVGIVALTSVSSHSVSVRLVVVTALLVAALLVADVAESLPADCAAWPALAGALRGRAGVLIAAGLAFAAAVALVDLVAVRGLVAVVVGMAFAAGAAWFAVRHPGSRPGQMYSPSDHETSG